MSDNEIIKPLGELAKIAPTPYLFEVCKNAAERIVELNRELDFARKQNEILGSMAVEADRRINGLNAAVGAVAKPQANNNKRGRESGRGLGVDD